MNSIRRSIFSGLASLLMLSSAMAQTAPATPADHVSVSRAHQLNSAMINNTVKVVVPYGSGSGTMFSLMTAVGRKDFVLTNAHVVSGLIKQCADLSMKADPEACERGIVDVSINGWISDDHKTYPVVYKGQVPLKAIDVADDLAIIILDDPWAGGYTEILPDDIPLEQSEDVFVAGCPIGENTQINKGMISLLRGMKGMIEVSAPIFPGNSGGGLYVENNGHFYFAGITTAVAIIEKTIAFEHGYAIPLPVIKKYLSSLNLTF